MSQSLLQARENLEWMCRSAWNISVRQLPGSGLILPRGYDKRAKDTESGVRDTNVGVQRIGLLSWQSGCCNSNQAKEQRMSEPSLRELEEQRDRLYARLAAAGDFRRGSVTENYRRCGKANCACAQPGHPGHGPRFLLELGRCRAAGPGAASSRPEKWRRCGGNWRATSSSPR